MFEKSGAENGVLPGLVAKQIFERARLPNEILGRIWTLSDTRQRGSLDVTEFVVAMHLLASYKSGAMRGVPNTLPPGLYEAAARRPPARVGSGSRPGSSALPSAALPSQFTGFSNAQPQSPITRQLVSTPLSTQSTGEGWVITPADKARFDSIFAAVDRQGHGYITGDQAVEFFGNARLPEEVLAQIWDLADINSEGTLNRDEFAVAMYLIRQQRATKDGRGVLPATLPPALVPPSMRKQAIPPPQPTAPAFENAPVTKSRSAADDLFGLDAFGPTPSTPAQAAQSTGGTDAGPFANPPPAAAPVVAPPPAAVSSSTSTAFKPFIPSSSFGQSIIPQSTGSPAPSQKAAPPTGSDDLLGDTDPEVSQRLTSETTELANLSNQVGNLSKKMTELQGTRQQNEQELSQHAAQKRTFEGRLAQLRSLYEKEVQEVKALQEQLTASKNETKRLQQEMAIIDGSHQDLATQHQQLRAQFEADQRENASLKEKIRQLNGDVDQLKPQLEKLKSDARQQKGLVAINKKQLATNEAERDRLKAEISAAQKQVEEATREAEESARQVEASKKELEETRSIPIPSVKSPPPVTSPAPSTSSNPFFKRTTTATSESAFSPPPASGADNQDIHSAFDSIFGPSFGSPADTPAPTTSFTSESPQNREASGGAPAPRIESPAASTTFEATVPPPPTQSNQIASTALPFRAPLEREDSISSSVKVVRPVSSLSTPSPRPQQTPEDPFTAAGPDEEQESVRKTLPQASDHEASTAETLGEAANEKAGDMPGAFPNLGASHSEAPSQSVGPAAVVVGAGAASLVAGTSLAVAAASVNEGDESKSKTAEPQAPGSSKPEERNFDDFFGGPVHQRTPSQQAADFDSAFANLPPNTNSNGTSASGNKEFPDIQELDNDDDSSVYSEETPLAFDDDFNKAQSQAPEPSQPESSSAGKQAESSSPAPWTITALQGTDTFPPKVADLTLGDQPIVAPTMGASSQPGFPSAASTLTSGPETSQAKSVSDSQPAPSAAKNTPFDFDSAFTSLGPAQVEEEDEDEDFGPPKPDTSDFDPTFDSPPQSRSTTLASNAPRPPTYNGVTNGAPQIGGNDFFNFTASEASTGPTQPAGVATGPVPSSHDWDAIFAPFGNQNTEATPAPAAATASALPSQSTAISPDAGATPAARAESNSATPSQFLSPTPAVPPKTANMSPSQRPQLGRALSSGTEHDDPILKRLTAMGWSREESLAALEKYDYNIDKVSYCPFSS